METRRADGVLDSGSQLHSGVVQVYLVKDVGVRFDLCPEHPESVILVETEVPTEPVITI